jgi:uncharacterized repeat protein (TIGR01451 family)
MVIVLLASLMAPYAAAQGPAAVQERGEGQIPDGEPEELLDFGLISQEEYEILMAELETPGAEQMGRPGSGISYVPPGWQRLDNAGSGGLWDSNDTFGVANRITYSGTGASGLSMAAEAYGSSIAWDAELWSPPIDLTSVPPSITLTFESNFQDYAGNGDAYLDVSTDGGLNWTNIHSQTTDDPTGGELELFDLSAYAGNMVILRWRYTCTSGTTWYWHIDNVTVLDAAGGALFFEDFEAPPMPDLSTSSKGAPIKVAIGEAITYTIVVSNSGNLTAPNTFLTDTIPAGSSYIADSLACDSGTCWYDAGDDAVYWTGVVTDGQGIDLTFAVDTSAAGCGDTITNTAVITDPLLMDAVVVEAATSLVNSFAFGTDFEADDGGFVNSGTVTDTWAWGDLVPSTGSPDAAHSGTKLWATVLDGDIPTEPSDHYLIKTITLPDDPTGVYMQWWDWWDEDGSDEGYVYVNDIANTLYFIEADQLSWEHHMVDLSAWAGQTVDIVFYYLAGGALDGGAGWYVDDFAIHGGCPHLDVGPNQADSACAPDVLAYQLEVMNANSMSDTIDILASADNEWPVTVDPLLLDLDAGMTGTVSVTVEIPWYATPGDGQMLNVTAVGQISGLVGEATVETTAALATGWEDLEPAPHAARYLAVVYDDGYLYQIGGNDGGYHDGTYAYDIAANTWMTMTSMITAAYYIDGAAIDGNIYIPGGYVSGSTWNSFVQVYSTTADAWNTVAPMPVPIRYHEVVAHDGLLYVLGGQTSGSTYTNTVQIYDPMADAWSLGTPMTIPVAYAASGVIDGEIYLAGGYNGSYQPELQIYDPATDSWRFGAPMEEGWVQAADGVKHDRYLIVAGGYYGSTATASNVAWVYDAVNDSWSLLPYVTSLRYGAEGDSDGSEFYYVSGREYDGTFFYSNRNEHLLQCEAPAANMSIYADPLSIPTCPGDTEMLDFQICNEGNAPLLFGIEEMTSTVKLQSAAEFYPAGSLPASPTPDVGLSVYAPFEGEIVAPEAPQNPTAVLWDQPITDTNLGAYANQDFETAVDAFDIFIADDFGNSEWWAIDTIYVPGNTWNLGGDLDCAGVLHWEIYADAGGVPAGDPWGGGDAPVWTYYGPTSDPNVAFSTGVGGFESNVTLNLDAPIVLPPGDWWLVFYPSLSFANCFQYGRHVSGTGNGAPAQVINPGGGFGFPTTWTSVQDPSTWAMTYHDFAFRLEGEVAGDVPWLSEDPTTGNMEPGECITVDVHLDATSLMPGDYHADLMVESNDPDTPVSTLPVRFHVWAPAAVMDVSYTVNDLEVTFDATVGGATPINYAWDFGDGGSSDVEDPVYTFGDYTCYTVTLAVDNTCGFDTWQEQICLELPVVYYYLPVVYKSP